MEKRILTEKVLGEFGAWLYRQERSSGTIEKYLRDTRAFARWLGRREVTRERAVQWKESLGERGYAPVTINAMLAALNGLFRFCGWEDCRVHFIKVQRRMFRDQKRQLTQEEYRRLVQTARRRRQDRLALLLEAICSTGIRVSEVRYLTVEAAREGCAEVKLKGKVRVILLSRILCEKLLAYARDKKITSGEIFLTGSGKSLSRYRIWAEMKALSRAAGVRAAKVFPHNLRHLFATVFFQACRDIVRLADILGHSSIETTRIYLQSTGQEQRKQLDRLGLIG